MGLLAGVNRELKFMRRLNRLLKRIKPVDPAGTNLLPDDFKKAVDHSPNNVAVICDARQLTYRELDSMANRYAHWIMGRGLRRGDTVALVMPNRLEYQASWLGFSKVGVATALVNNNLTGAAQAHRQAISGATQVLADYSTWEAVEDVRHDLPKHIMLRELGLRTEDVCSDRRGLDSSVKGASTVRHNKSAREDMHARDTAHYIQSHI